MAVEDGAVLAKIFSHLLREDQIATFLFAFQDLRQERVAMMLKTENFNIMFMTLPSCEMQEMRDNGFKMLHAAGKNVMEASEATEQWEEIKITFAYDCEDEADDWCVKTRPILRDLADQEQVGQLGLAERTSKLELRANRHP
jgi:salicylate hydroxylase